jgi:hypothetical protein
MRTHILKTWPEYFHRVVIGQKPFEVRKTDRDFQVNDIVILKEYDPERKEYLGGEIHMKITYVLSGGQFGIEPGYCVFGVTELIN